MGILLEDSDIAKRLLKASNQRTLTGLAKSIGMNKSAPNNWKKANKIPNEVVFKTAEIFGCSIDYLFYGVNNNLDKNEVDNIFSKCIMMLIASETIKLGDEYDEKVIKKVGEYLYKSLNKETVSDEFVEIKKLIDCRK